jgi:hypothetical protein
MELLLRVTEQAVALGLGEQACEQGGDQRGGFTRPPPGSPSVICRSAATLQGPAAAARLAMRRPPFAGSPAFPWCPAWRRM